MKLQIFISFLFSFLLNICGTHYATKYFSPIYKKNTSVKSFMRGNHQKKKNTPSMCGLASVLSFSISLLSFCDIKNHSILLLFFVIISFGLLGLVDDISKLSPKNLCLGLSSKAKLITQLVLSTIFMLLLKKYTHLDTSINIANMKIDLGILYIPLSILIISFSSNAVNLTDGLDGLATFAIFIASTTMGVIAIIHNEPVEFVIICSIISGVHLAFLWFNSYPSSVFMGDVGSLSFGALLATISILTKSEFEFIILSGLFNIEAFSSAIQICSIKIRQKSIFLMAPIHHHFEILGLHETKIVTRLWIFAILFSSIAILISTYHN